jgi:HEAT repeat protein
VTRPDEPFESLLAELVDSSKPVRAAVIYRLAEPSDEEFALFQAAWADIPDDRKCTLLARLTDASETDFLLDFTTVAQFALLDDDPVVRSGAIGVLWTDDEPNLMNQLIGILKSDPDDGVRAAAADALGRFVLQGELGELATRANHDLKQALIDFGLHDEAKVDVYRRSFESLSYLNGPEILPIIERLFDHESTDLRASAYLAMGRSGDQRWAHQVLAGLEDREPQVRYESVRAAGELALLDATPILIGLANNPEDREIQEMAIWALGEIGGTDAQQALFDLSEQNLDGGLIDSVEDAMNVAALALGDLGIHRVTGNDDDDLEEEFETFDDAKGAGVDEDELSQ